MPGGEVEGQRPLAQVVEARAQDCNTDAKGEGGEKGEDVHRGRSSAVTMKPNRGHADAAIARGDGGIINEGKRPYT
ncbi:hypothetical protein DLREEDagr8_50440 [Dongia sp. agr-C8]